jgi:predicted lipid-binding transport protein (Tim44 family)
MPTGVIELLILAAVALFLLFRLRGVLGTKTGLEEQQGRPVRRPEPARPIRPAAPVADEDEIDPDSLTVADGDAAVGAALAAMRRAEPGFLPTEFIQGARQAFEMILMAFETGDLDTLKRFLAPDVYASFREVIDARKAAGYSVDARFVGVREARVTGARFDPASGEAEIALRFTAEMVKVVRDRELRVVEGDPNEIRRETDTWTFARRMGSNDPNWQLVATGE